MDTLCGIGLPEIVILILISFVVIGPERSRELALTAGRWLRRIMTSAWWREFNNVAGALRDLPNTLVRMSELEDSLRQIQTDMNQATQVDLDLSVPAASQPPVPGAITDPVEISNATAQTIYPSEQPPHAPTPPEADELHDS